MASSSRSASPSQSSSRSSSRAAMITGAGAPAPLSLVTAARFRSFATPAIDVPYPSGYGGQQQVFLRTSLPRAAPSITLGGATASAGYPQAGSYDAGGGGGGGGWPRWATGVVAAIGGSILLASLGILLCVCKQRRARSPRGAPRTSRRAVYHAAAAARAKPQAADRRASKLQKPAPAPPLLYQRYSAYADRIAVLPHSPDPSSRAWVRGGGDPDGYIHFDRSEASVPTGEHRRERGRRARAMLLDKGISPPASVSSMG